MDSEERKSSIQSVDRAVFVLELLARRGWSGVTEVAGELGIHKSNAQRLLATLASHGMVERSPETDKYRLGFRLVGLASAVTGELDVVRYARPFCESLSEQTGETVIVALLEGDEAVIVHQTAAPSVLGVNWSGWHLPLHCTPGGKVLLAHLPEERREAVLAEPLERFTENTVVEPGKLRDELEAIRSRGYSYTIEELAVGLNGVGAPIYRPEGEVTAALSVAGPAFRLTESSVPRVGELTRGAAVEVSRRLGFRE